MSTFSSPKVESGMKVEDLANLVAMLIEEIDYLLNGNVDAKNIRANSITAKLIEVGALVVGDNVIMGPNAVISWGKVTDQPNIPSSAADVGALATNSPMLTYIGPTGIYTGQLTANQIIAGKIAAAFIDTEGLGAERIYQPGIPNNYGVMGGEFGDLALFYNLAEYFRIYNGGTNAQLRYQGKAYLQMNATDARPLFSWDFNGATVSGITTSEISGLEARLTNIESRLSYLDNFAFRQARRVGNLVWFDSKNTSNVDFVDVSG